MELTMCIHAVDVITRLWEISEDEDKQGMARHLFEHIIYDLDRQEIVDFRLKPWADQFLMLRVGLYAEEQYYNVDNNDRRVALRGFTPRDVPYHTRRSQSHATLPFCHLLRSRFYIPINHTAARPANHSKA